MKAIIQCHEIYESNISTSTYWYVGIFILVIYVYFEVVSGINYQTERKNPLHGSPEIANRLWVEATNLAREQTGEEEDWILVGNSSTLLGWTCDPDEQWKIPKKCCHQKQHRSMEGQHFQFKNINTSEREAFILPASWARLHDLTRIVVANNDQRYNTYDTIHTKQ